MAKRKRLTKKQRKRRNNWLLALFIGIIIFLGGYLAGHRDFNFRQVQVKLDETKSKVEQRLKSVKQVSKTPNIFPSKKSAAFSEIHLFDVGQGSSILLVAKDGSTILINTGAVDDSEKKIISYLDQEVGLGGIIDLLIFTNNDLNHIGHGHLVLEYFDVQEVWMGGGDPATKVYTDLTNYLAKANIDYQKPKAGETFSKQAFELQVLHPEKENEEASDESLIVRVMFDDISIMIAADASVTMENEVIKKLGDLSSDLLVMGSAGEQWIEAVDPKMAFYQTDKENTEEYPSAETIEKIQTAGIAVYGTDNFGTISLYIDDAGEFTVESNSQVEN